MMLYGMLLDVCEAAAETQCQCVLAVLCNYRFQNFYSFVSYFKVDFSIPSDRNGTIVRKSSISFAFQFFTCFKKNVKSQFFLQKWWITLTGRLI